MSRDSSAALEVRDLAKHFPVSSGLWGRRDVVRAVDGIHLELKAGETLSIVGESGSGKSTLGRMIVGLTPPTGGEIRLEGRRIDNLSRKDFRPLRKQIQVIFQDPLSSLNPRHRVKDIVAEPIRNFRLEESEGRVQQRVSQLLERVGLPAQARDRFPHEFSGGQRQRICIARALSVNPSILVCDEAVSALDVSVKAQIINLLMDLQKDLGISIIFISHDLAIVERITQKVAVMYLGKIVEYGTREEIFGSPLHPYTRALIAAVPVPVFPLPPKPLPLQGDIPSPLHPPPGCSFGTRCPLAFERCASVRPVLRPLQGGREVACHLHE